MQRSKLIFRKSWSAVVLGTLLPLLYLAVAPVELLTAEPSPQVGISVGVYKGEKLNPELTDLLTAKLSKQGLLLIERQQVDLLLGEWRKSGFSQEYARQVNLGKLLGVRYFVWLTIPEEPARPLLEIVDARTGQSVIHNVLTESASSIPDLIARVAKEVEHYSQINQYAAGGAVFATPVVLPPDPKRQAFVDAALTDLTSLLTAAHVPLLHRRYVEYSVQEKLWSEKGLVETDGASVPFQGATHVVATRVREQGDQFLATFIVLETATGRRVGYREVNAHRTATGVQWDEGLVKWLQGLIKPSSTGRPLSPRKVSEGVNPEALAQFFTGVRLHNQGRYFDAIEAFTESAGHDCRFLSPVLWMISAYRHSGFEEVARRMDNFLIKNRNVVNGAPLDPNLSHPSPGISFAGVTGDDDRHSALQVPISMHLIDALHTATEARVFVPDDIAALRTEFDTLVGLSSVAGATWQTAPPFLYADTVTAHLRACPEGLAVELCRVINLDPTDVRRLVVSLPSDNGAWATVLAQAVRKLFAEQSPGLIPAPMVGENETTLVADLQHSYRDSQYLKLLSLNPNHAEFLDSFPQDGGGCSAQDMNIGLHEWLLRRMSPDVAQRPWVEFSFINRFNPTCYGSIMVHSDFEEPKRDKPEVYVEKLRRFTARYPDHPAGLIARYNTILFDLTESNALDSSHEVARIAQALERAPDVNRIDQIAIQAMRDMQAVLNCPKGTFASLPEKVELRGFLSTHALCKTPCHIVDIPLYFNHPLWPAARKQENALVAFHILPWLLRNAPLPVAVVADLLRQYPRNSMALGYAGDTVGTLFGSCDTTASAAETMCLLEPYTAALCGRLQQKCGDYHCSRTMELACLGLLDPPKPFLFHPSFHVCKNRATIEALGGDSPLHHELLTNQSFIACQNRLRQALIESVQAGRFSLGPESRLRTFLKDDKLNDGKLVTAQEEILRRKVEVAWEQGPLSSSENAKAWEEYVKWMDAHVSKTKRADWIMPYLPQLHHLYDNAPNKLMVFSLYSQFANFFFWSGSYDAAEKLIDQILGWPELTQLTPEKAHLQFLRAQLYQRDGDAVSAFRLAKRTLEEIKAKPNRNDYALFIDFENNGFRGGGSLQIILADYISTLRDDPRAPFHDPFDAPSANGSYRK
jgi:hypothetical protein